VAEHANAFRTIRIAANTTLDDVPEPRHDHVPGGGATDASAARQPVASGLRACGGGQRRNSCLRYTNRSEQRGKHPQSARVAPPAYRTVQLPAGHERQTAIARR
jgi:hypothetical protein